MGRGHALAILDATYPRLEAEPDWLVREAAAARQVLLLVAAVPVARRRFLHLPHDNLRAGIRSAGKLAIDCAWWWVATGRPYK